MKVVYTDVLVIGGGLAGLRVAIGARRAISPRRRPDEVAARLRLATRESGRSR
jgi:cation diffusion facilitator CzcD-associated flavoprotein CzcO